MEAVHFGNVSIRTHRAGLAAARCYTEEGGCPCLTFPTAGTAPCGGKLLTRFRPSALCTWRTVPTHHEFREGIRELPQPACGL